MTEVPRGEQIEDKSLGELVAMASKNASQLLRSEIELAKTELKVDARKALTGTALFSVALVVLAPVIILIAIGFAYVLVGWGVWHWAAFFIVAAVYTLVAALLGFVGFLYFKRIKGTPRTRQTLKDLPSAFHHDDGPALTAPASERALTD